MPNTKYKPLPHAFKRDGFLHTQLKRDGDVVLVKKTKDGMKYSGYEVFLVQRHEGRAEPLNGCILEPAEHSPSSILWGEQGWSFTGDDLAGAEKRFAALVALASEPAPAPKSQRKIALKIKIKNL